MVDQASPEQVRATLSRARRVVVKIGSQSLARRSGDGPDVWARLAGDIASIMHPEGRPRREVVLVSSGAIALGVQLLGKKRRPQDMPTLQAAAAAGQGLLMQRYTDAFSAHQIRVAQVLLTHADLASRQRARNAQQALERLLELGVVPIINENDAVAVDEIRFGDNDELAAMVTPLCQAELLVLLSHVDGLLDESGARIPFAGAVDEALALVTEETSAEGRGGMRSKLEAAARASLAGAHVVLAPAHGPHILERVLGGDDVGTLLPAVPQRLSTRKHWIAYTLRPRGVAIVDDGAADAVRHRGRSVLCVGVVGVRGAFGPGDAISIVSRDGTLLARGLSRLSASDASRLAGRLEGEPKAMRSSAGVLVHRDDLVVLPRPVRGLL